MLVLTRKTGDGIVIGDDVIIKVIEIKSGGIRLGIDAPKDMKIYRQEIYEQISRENIEAAHWDPTDLDSLTETFSKKKK
ncbi:MAG: carbon storage regulator CsrA [Thermodesulfobacteriota bacterium]